MLYTRQYRKIILNSDLFANYTIDRLVVAGDDALLVVAGGLIVGINDGVRGHTVGVVRLSPGVDGVDVRNVLEHGGAEKGEHFCSTKVHVRESRGKNLSMKENSRSETTTNSMLQKDSEGQEGIERQEVERERAKGQRRMNRRKACHLRETCCGADGLREPNLKRLILEIGENRITTFST
jgi:hypothetical protein